MNDSGSEVAVSELEIATEDGHIIEATLVEPSRANGISVQINSALAVPRQYYRHYARYLAGRGFTVLSYDYRGLVKPGKDIRKDISTIVDWGRYDQAAATSWLVNRYPAHKLVLVAHSLGGQIIGLSPRASDFRAVFMVTSSHGYWRRFPSWKGRLHQLVLWHLIAPPLIALRGYLPGNKVGMFDMPSRAAWQMRRFCFNRHWLCDDNGNPYRPHNGEVRVPLRHILLTDDEVVPPEARIDLDDFYPNADGREEILQPADFGMEQVGHFGYFRRSMASSAWDESARWLADAL